MGRYGTIQLKSKPFTLVLLILLTTIAVFTVVTAVAEEQPKADPDDDRAPTAALTIIKTAVTPSMVLGSSSEDTATFKIEVLNTSPDINLTNVTVSDPLAPNCDRNIGNLAASANFPEYFCTKSNIQQVFTNTINVEGTNPLNNSTESDSDQAVVEVLDLIVNVTASPQALMEPGGVVTFNVTMINTGSVDTTLQNLSSAQFGDLLNDQNTDVQDNTCLPDSDLPQLTASGGNFSCSFKAIVTSQPPTYSVVVTAVAVDDNNISVSNFGISQITIENTTATLNLELDATPDRVTIPGGIVNFYIDIQNSSVVDTITIDTLTEDVLGDLNGQGDCTLPQVIVAGSSYSCSYSDDLSGNENNPQTRLVTVSGIDDDDPPNPISDTDSATVEFLSPPDYIIFLPILVNEVDEPNNNCESAYPLLLNREYFFFANDQNDWYTFELDTQGDLSVKLTNFVPKLGQIVVYGGDSCADLTQESILGNNGNSNSTKLVPLGTQPAGRYFVRIFNEGSLNTVEPYSLNINFSETRTDS